MRNILKYIVLTTLVCGLSSSVSKKPEKLDSVIIKVVKAFKEHDAKTLNDLIKKDIGLIFVFRTGMIDEFQRTSQIDFAKPTPGYLPYLDVFSDYKIRFESLPLFDCDSMKWNKSGLYCDTTQTNHLLSTIAQNLKEFSGDKIDDSEINKFKEIENASRRIVLTDEKDGDFIFYLTLIKHKWFLTIIDRVTSDCSA